MFSDRVFQIALLVSVVIHGVILFQNTNLSLFSKKDSDKKIELSYVKTPVKSETQRKLAQVKREPFLNIPKQIIVDKRLPPPPFVDKENILKANRAMQPQNPTANKPALIKPDILAIRKKITLPPIDLDKINNPTYLSYYQIVREKIKRCAYQNYTGTETGEVTISFIISGDGYLRDLRLVEEKSVPSDYLRDLALRSIKDASPFPEFPKELDYPQLSFNLAITFEIE